jgi:SAM-dependent methyltransferase
MREERNTYIFDAESPMELARLINQHQFVTSAMGGPLNGLPELPEGARVLDLACGPGGWVLDVAFARPDIEACGVDLSRTMVDYAYARASSQDIINASFGVMDITQSLDFADAFFDLVNASFLVGVLKREAWPPFIAECTRILRPAGILHFVEGDDPGKSLSPALEQLNNLGMRALNLAGYGFSLDGCTFGMSPALLYLLKQAGYWDVHIAASTLNNSADTQEWANFHANQEIMLLQAKQLIVRSGLLTDKKFDALYQQALIEMYAPDFVATGVVLSTWGRKTE